jgi:LmbE family N-acetylglucosaminyl deacetylase
MQAASPPRTLLIAAHPDDETVGAAIHISQTPEIHIVHVTEGSPPNPDDALAVGCYTREEYARARRHEAVRAMALAGVSADAITNLYFIDQRVSFELEYLTDRILTLLEKFQPDIVLTHAYEGGHPDHDSIAFACQSAKKLYELDHPKPTFDLIEFTSYHAESGGIKTYSFLPCKDHEEIRHHLSPAERALKLRMLQEFKTQQKTLAPFMLPELEIFRPAPNYDFHRAPHSGRLFYEYFDWGMDGATWRDLARDAERSLLNPRAHAA